MTNHPSQPPVRIVAYDPRWPALYAAERDALMALPGHPFVEIEHFGSTAVPGLRAKPVIDIMASVRGLAEGEAFVPRLTEAGYVLVDVGFRTRLFFTKAGAEGEGFHLHLVQREAWAEKNERLFRDWLLARSDVAIAYAQLKAELAERFASDRRAYTEAKTAFITTAVNDARAARGLPPTNAWEE